MRLKILFKSNSEERQLVFGSHSQVVIHQHFGYLKNSLFQSLQARLSVPSYYESHARNSHKESWSL